MTHSRNYHLWHLVMSDISLSTDMKKVAGYYQLLRRMAVYFSGTSCNPPSECCVFHMVII